MAAAAAHNANATNKHVNAVLSNADVAFLLLALNLKHIGTYCSLSFDETRPNTPKGH
jgi:hypothetical protein